MTPIRSLPRSLALACMILAGMVLPTGARQATPEPDEGAQPDGVTVEVVVETVLDADWRPAPPVSVRFQRITIPPGRITISIGTAGSDGLLIDHVIEGAFCAEGGGHVVRAGAAVGNALGGCPDLRLGQGDTVAFEEPAGQSTVRTLGNPEPERTVVLSMHIGAVHPSPPPSFTTDVAYTELATVPSEEWSALPAGPLTLTFRRVDLDSQARLPAPASDAVQVVLPQFGSQVDGIRVLPDGTVQNQGASPALGILVVTFAPAAADAEEGTPSS